MVLSELPDSVRLRLCRLCPPSRGTSLLGRESGVLWEICCLLWQKHSVPYMAGLGICPLKFTQLQL